MEIPVPKILSNEPADGREAKVALNDAPVELRPGLYVSEEKLAILQRFDSRCLYGDRNRLHLAV